MSTKKKKASAKGSAKFKDLSAKKNPKGGAYDAFLKVDTGRVSLNPQPLPP
jgi:hypothetical protein